MLPAVHVSSQEALTIHHLHAGSSMRRPPLAPPRLLTPRSTPSVELSISPFSTALVDATGVPSGPNTARWVTCCATSCVRSHGFRLCPWVDIKAKLLILGCILYVCCSFGDLLEGIQKETDQILHGTDDCDSIPDLLCHIRRD